MTMPATPLPLGSDNILILVERPGDEVQRFGDLIAALCRAGRPPFVVVLTDGPALDPAADARTRHTLARLGLDGGRMLMFGIAGEAPRSGPVFQAAVRALCFVTWRHDCNILAAPAGLTFLAQAVADQSGLGLAQAAGSQLHLLRPPSRSAREDPPPIP